MRTVFLGSPAFAAPSLEALSRHPEIDVVLTVTQPDRPAGRGNVLKSPAVKLLADEFGLPTIQPESMRDPTTVERIRATSPDVLIVVAYGELLQREILDLAPHGCVNVHPSLLPRYRGATPIPAAILAGDMTTGVSIIRLERRLDAGPIIAQRACAIEPRDTTGSLSGRLSFLAADMLPSTTIDYVAGAIEPVSQDDSLATHTREWTSADAKVDWTQSALSIDRLVRASNPWPVAWSILDGNRFRILDASIDGDAAPEREPGTIDVASGQVRVATGSGWLRLNVVQPAGKRSMPAVEWLRGARVMSPRFNAG